MKFVEVFNGTTKSIKMEENTELIKIIEEKVNVQAESFISDMKANKLAEGESPISYEVNNNVISIKEHVFTPKIIDLSFLD